MFVPVESFVEVVEALGRNPSGLAVSLNLRQLCVLIDHRESST